MRTGTAIIAGCISLMIAANQAVAAMNYLTPEGRFRDDASVVVNRPANVQGLTGLIITNSAYTQPKGRVVAGLATIAENSSNPDFSIVQGIATVTAGVADRIELGVRAQIVGTNLGSSATSEVGFGDTDLLFKWRVSSQGETLPAVALGLMVTLPTGESSKRLSSVEHEGVRLLVIGTTEQEMPGDYFIGVYFEGQLAYYDRLPWDDPKSYSDKYGVFNAGLLFPLVNDRKVQAVLEYNTVVKKDIPSVYEQNGKAIMPGLRYVTQQLNVSLGVQFLDREAAGFDDTTRYIGTISYAF
jgi:hypothetical protein